MTREELNQQLSSILDEHHFKECRSEVLFQLRQVISQYESEKQQELVKSLEEFKGSSVRLNKKLVRKLHTAGADPIKKAVVMQDFWDLFCDKAIEKVRGK